MNKFRVFIKQLVYFSFLLIFLQITILHSIEQKQQKEKLTQLNFPDIKVYYVPMIEYLKRNNDFPILKIEIFVDTKCTIFEIKEYIYYVLKKKLPTLPFSLLRLRLSSTGKVIPNKYIFCPSKVKIQPLKLYASLT